MKLISCCEGSKPTDLLIPPFLEDKHRNHQDHPISEKVPGSIPPGPLWRSCACCCWLWAAGLLLLLLLLLPWLLLFLWLRSRSCCCCSCSCCFCCCFWRCFWRWGYKMVVGAYLPAGVGTDVVLVAVEALISTPRNAGHISRRLITRVG